jgi:hypothetical protein
VTTNSFLYTFCNDCYQSNEITEIHKLTTVKNINVKTRSGGRLLLG